MTEDSKLYTSNVFFILGEWNTIDDTNTLVDVGADPIAIKKLQEMNTGLGKRKVDQVIITHSHSDHAAILPAIIDAFNPKVYGFNIHMKGITNPLRDGEILRIGEKMFEVIHITTHSCDSVCLFCEEDGILFTGDTNFPLEFENQSLRDENALAVSRLQRKVITKIYPGHGAVQHFNGKKFQLMR